MNRKGLEDLDERNSQRIVLDKKRTTTIHLQTRALDPPVEHSTGMLLT